MRSAVSTRNAKSPTADYRKELLARDLKSLGIDPTQERSSDQHPENW